MLWRPHGTYTRIIEQTSTTDLKVDRLRLSVECDDWTQLRTLQILMVEDTAVVCEAGGSQTAETDQQHGGGQMAEPDRRSTIPEGANENDELSSPGASVGSYLHHSDVGLQKILEDTWDDLEVPLPDGSWWKSND